MTRFLLISLLAISTALAADFPPLNSAKPESGQLVRIDFILRKGDFITEKGETKSFHLPPFASVRYLNAEADLRDLAIGTNFEFALLPGNAVAVMRDQFSQDQGVPHKLDAVKDGKLVTAKGEVALDAGTQFWKGDQPAKLEDLQPGDEFLYNLAGKTASEVWIGAETARQATEKQRAKFIEFTKARGVPMWVDKTEGNLVTATVIGDPELFRTAFQPDFVVGKAVRLCVANRELRTWNPPVDGENSGVQEAKEVPITGYGCGGMQFTVKPPNMLEGFRRGRIVRVFGAGWPAKDQFYGESLMGYGYGRMVHQELLENPAQEYAEQFPFRTDYSNEKLPWFKLVPGEIPPPFSGHLIIGDLIAPGQFKDAQTGEIVSFTLLPEGKVRYLNADATLENLPLGTRYRFTMYQDASGKFTLASEVKDEFSYLAGNGVTYRVEASEDGALAVAGVLPKVKNYNGDMETPPDIGRALLRLAPDAKVAGVKVGDMVLVNLGTGGVVTEVWIGEETHKKVTEAQQKLYQAPAKPAK